MARHDREEVEKDGAPQGGTVQSREFRQRLEAAPHQENKGPKMRSLGVPQKRGTFPEEGPPSLRWDWGNFLPSTGQAPLPKKPSGKETTLGPWGERRKKDMEREEAGWGAAHW